MPHKKGTHFHKYTEEDFERIAKGDFIEGVDIRSQRYALERHRLCNLKHDSRTGNMYSRPVFTPQEDLQVLESNFPKTHSKEECIQRRKYLIKNYCEVGWRSLIGTQTIHW